MAALQSSAGCGEGEAGAGEGAGAEADGGQSVVGLGSGLKRRHVLQLRADLERSREALGKAVEDKNTLLGEKVSLERQVFEAEKMAWEVRPCGGGNCRWMPCG